MKKPKEAASCPRAAAPRAPLVEIQRGRLQNFVVATGMVALEALMEERAEA